MARISVIVPIYNAEPYLAACLRSVLAQTFTDFELLLMDDGSLDGSREICEAFERQDKRIRLICLPHGGVSAARNRGIEEASGEFIAFVDADDWVHPQYLETLLRGMSDPLCGISCCGYRDFSDERELDTPVALPEKGRVIERQEAFALLDLNPLPISLYLVIPCAKLYRREVLAGIRFPEGVRHEDEWIAHLAVAQCQRLIFLDATLYGYRRHAGSYMGIAEYWLPHHLVLLDALSARTDYYAEHAQACVSGAMKHLLRDCAGFYTANRETDDFPAVKERVMAVYAGQYRKQYPLMRTGERLKGRLFLRHPDVYVRLLARWYELQRRLRIRE